MTDCPADAVVVVVVPGLVELGNRDGEKNGIIFESCISQDLGVHTQAKKAFKTKGLPA